MSDLIFEFLNPKNSKINFIIRTSVARYFLLALLQTIGL